MWVYRRKWLFLKVALDTNTTLLTRRKRSSVSMVLFAAFSPPIRMMTSRDLKKWSDWPVSMVLFAAFSPPIRMMTSRDLKKWLNWSVSIVLFAVFSPPIRMMTSRDLKKYLIGQFLRYCLQLFLLQSGWWHHVTWKIIWLVSFYGTVGSFFSSNQDDDILKIICFINY
jgi:hypothetical protein